MNLSFYQKDRDVFIHDSIHEKMLLERHTNTRNMIRAIMAGDANAAFECMAATKDSITDVNRIYTPEEDNFRQMKNHLISLQATLYICADLSNVHPLYLHTMGRRYDKKIEQLMDPVQAIAIVREMVESYCGIIRHTQTEHYGEFSDRVIQLLLSNLSSPPSLDRIAEEMNVASATVSRRFKAETGQTIPEFTNRYRIRLAKLYMQEDTANLSEIAQRLGFSDASYFSKVFYRYTGMTPSAYQKKQD